MTLGVFVESVIGWIRQRKLVMSILAVTLVLALPISAILFSPTLRQYLYREMSYQLLADRIAGNETNPERIAIRLADYVEESLYPGGGPVLDVTSWNDLVRGIGWCDQHDWTFGTLLSKKGIHARLVFLTDRQGIGRHVMAEVFLNDQWRVLDPYFGLVLDCHNTRTSFPQSLSGNRLILLDFRFHGYDNVCALTFAIKY